MRDPRRPALRVALAALVLGWLPVLSWPAPADATTPADLDSAFGTGGLVDADPGDRSYASHGLAAPRDATGRLLVAGRVDHLLRSDTLVARFTTGGALDTSFGDGGYAIRPSDFGFFEPTAITTASDGTIWVAGWTNTTVPLAFGLVRDTLVYHFSADGDLLGRLIHDVGGDDRANGLVVVGGDVLLTGYARPRGATHFEPLGQDRDLYVARLDGATTELDPAFGDNGVTLLDEGTIDDFSEETGLAVGAGPGGTIVVGGYGVDQNFTTPHLLALRLTAAGDLDTSFSGDGVATRPASWEPTVGIVDASRRVVLAGQDGAATSVARFTTAGAVDSTFSGDGTATIDVGFPTALTTSPDGGLAVSAGLVVGRLTGAGAPLGGFGTNGVSRAADRDHLGDGAAVVDDAGKVWLAGSTTDLTDSSGGDDQPTDLLAARLAPTGALDTTFGTNGRRALDLHLSGMTQLRTVRVDGQGRLVVAGVTQADPAYHQDLYLARYTAAGAIDTTFGDGGVTIENLDRFDLGYDEVRQIAFDSLGRIVVVGSAYSQLQEEYALVARFTADGALDTGFSPSPGVAGIGYLDGAGPGRAVAVDPQDRVLVGWTTAPWGGASDLQVTRLLTSGAIDTSFGSGGTASVDVGTTDDTVAVEVDGSKILVAGQADDAMAVARLTATGALDSTFSGDGVAAVTPPAFGQRVRDLVVDTAHRPVLAGTTQSEGTVVRFTAGGAPDSGFGTGGVATIRASDAQTQVTGVALDGDRVAAAVTTWPTGADYDIGVARVNADGTMDTGFDGGDGVASIDRGAWELSSKVVVLGTGRIVVAGTSQYSFDLPPAELPNIGGTRQFADGLLVGFRGGASVSLKTLTVQRNGTGAGDVTATGIDCGADCSEAYAAGTTVTLTATAQGGSTFTGWTGCTPIDATRCQVTMSAARTVTATFDGVTTSSRLLTVARSGLGGGRVLGPGIDCGGAGDDCSELFLDGSVVNLAAIPDTGSTFGGWTGCDSTSGTSCDLTINGATRKVTARFDASGPTTRQLSVSIAGDGGGQVHDDLGQVSCPGTCTAAYTDGATVTLTATADAGSSFAGWTGCPQPNGATCRATMNQNRSVTASFAAVSAPETAITGLTVKRARRKATLTFTGIAAGPVTFQCRLDGQRWRSCTSPKTYKRLSGGSHTVKVRAVDAGSKDPTPATKTFRI